jgi:hypothetical protein
MSEKKYGIENEAKNQLMDDCLLDTSVHLGHTSDGQQHWLYNFEIQLPSLSEFCIDWMRNNTTNLPDVFQEEQWVFDEVKIWAEDGGSETMIDDEPKGKEIERAEIEIRLSQYGLSLTDMAKHYYARGVAGGKSPIRAHVAREWHSPFPQRD